MKILNIIKCIFLFLVLSGTGAYAQNITAWSVLEYDSIAPASVVTKGTRLAYSKKYNSFYRWDVICSCWKRFAGPGITDTTYSLSFSSPNLSLLGSGSSVSLTSLYTAGWGLTKTSEEFKVDTSKVATRYYASTLPSSILSGQIAYSNGSNLVGSANLTYNGTTSLTFAERAFNLSYGGAITTGATNYNGYATFYLNRNSTIRGASSGNAMSFHTLSPMDFYTTVGLSMRINSSSGLNYLWVPNGGSPSYVPNQGIGTIGSIIAGSGTLWGNNPNTLPSNIMMSEGGMYTGLTIPNVNSNLIFQVGSTSKASLPWPVQTTAQANAIVGIAGGTQYESDINAIRWYNGTRKAYALESTFARGTATYIPYFDANGQVIQNAFLAMLGATAAIKIPVGTTAQRPTVSTGLIRYNSETQSLEASNGTTFITLAQANNATGTFTSGFIPYGSGVGSRLNESGNFTYSGGVLQLVSGSLGVNNSPTGTTILTALDLARTAGSADPSVGSGIGIQFRRRESSNAFTANVLSHEIFAFSAGVVTSGYRFTVHNNTSGSNPATTAFLINGHNVSVPDGGFTVSNSTVTPYVNITTTASSGNKEAGLYIKSRGDFGSVIEFDNASTSPGASALGNILNFYNYKTANSGFTVVRMGGGNGNYGMDVVGQFTVRDSVDNLDRFQVNSGGTIIMNAYGTPATTSATLGKTESGYLASFATDGTVTSFPMTSTPSIYNNLPNGNVSVDADANELEIINVSDLKLHNENADGLTITNTNSSLISTEDLEVSAGDYNKIILADESMSFELGNGNVTSLSKMNFDTLHYSLVDSRSGSFDTLFKVKLDVGDDAGLVTLGKYTYAAPFTSLTVGEDATDLFLTTTSTTGKVIGKAMRQTTKVKDADLTVTDDMLDLSMDIHVWAYCSVAASDSVVIDLPTPGTDYLGQMVSVYGDGRNATLNRDVYVRCVGAKLWHGNASPTGETYYQVTSLALARNSRTAEFTCVQNPDDNLYYWQLKQHP